MLKQFMNSKFTKNGKFQNWLVILFIVILLALALGSFFKSFVEGFENQLVELDSKVKSITFHQGTAVSLQISQVAVYTAEDPTTNIAPHGKATANASEDTGQSGGNARSAVAAPIDGVLETRTLYNMSKAGGFISPDTSPANYWKLDLPQAVNLNKLVYYERGDSPYVVNSYGSFFTLEDEAGKVIWTSPIINIPDMILTYRFTQKPGPASAPPPPASTPPPPSIQVQKGDTGPQGPPGPKGERGPPGPMGFLGFVDVRKKNMSGSSYPPAKHSNKDKNSKKNNKVKPHNSCDDEEEEDDDECSQ